MKIGTDISLLTCRAEGYLVAEAPVRGFNDETEIHFTQSVPDDVPELGWKGGRFPVRCPDNQYPYMEDTWLSVNDLWEMYQTNKAGIDSATGDIWENKPVTLHEALRLASSINAYCGLSHE